MLKLPRPRVWMLLAAVALLASAIEFTGIGPRWRSYRRSAGDCSVTADACRTLTGECRAEAARLRELAKGVPPEEATRLSRAASGLEMRAEEWRQLADWNERSVAIYREAGARPWGKSPRIPPFILRTSRPQLPRSGKPPGPPRADPGWRSYRVRGPGDP